MSTALSVNVQRTEALKNANRHRLDACQVREEIRTGEVKAADALTDPRAGGLPLWRLLNAIPHWGTVKVERLCRQHRVSPGRKVRELTDRERREISASLGDL